MNGIKIILIALCERINPAIESERSEKYILENVYTRSAIVINLTNKMQQIDFWLGVEE